MNVRQIMPPHTHPSVAELLMAHPLTPLEEDLARNIVGDIDFASFKRMVQMQVSDDGS